MAKGFYGRCAAYEAGLAAGEAELADALRRNLYGTVAPPADLAAVMAYVRREAAALERQDLAALMGGRLDFGPPPGPGGTAEALVVSAKTPRDKDVDRF
jgi:cytochrome b pre-mRNA-processing protein 3